MSVESKMFDNRRDDYRRFRYSRRAIWLVFSSVIVVRGGSTEVQRHASVSEARRRRERIDLFGDGGATGLAEMDRLLRLLPRVDVQLRLLGLATGDAHDATLPEDRRNRRRPL